MMGAKFHIEVDNAASYELSNDGTITIPMTQGIHSIEISVFGILKKKKFSFQAVGNSTFTCKPNPMGAVNVRAEPVKVTDSSGREY